MQPLCKQRLLLIAAAERPEQRPRSRRTHVEIDDEAVHHRPLARVPPPVAVEGRQHHVFAERERAYAAIVGAISGQENDSGCERGAGPPFAASVWPPTAIATGAPRPSSAEDKRQFADPGLLETREAKDFSGVQSECDVLELFAGQPLDFHEDFARSPVRVDFDVEVRPEAAENRRFRGRGGVFILGRADHHRDDGVVVCFGRAPDISDFAVSQHRHAGGLAPYLGETVRHHQHAHARLCERCDFFKIRRGLVARQRRRDLVENKQRQLAWRAVKRDGEGDERAFGWRQAACDHARIDANAKSLEHRFDFAVKLAPLDEARAGRVAPIESNAFGDTRSVDQRRFLVNNGDPQFGRMLRRQDRGDVAVLDGEGAAIGLVDPAQDLGEGRFSAAIRAKQRMDLAVRDRDRDVVEHADARKGFEDAVYGDGHQ